MQNKLIQQITDYLTPKFAGFNQEMITITGQNDTEIFVCIHHISNCVKFGLDLNNPCEDLNLYPILDQFIIQD